MNLVVWILGIAFFTACPQAFTVALTVVAWFFVDPGGTTLLGFMFAASLVYTLASGGRGYGMRRAW